MTELAQESSYLVATMELLTLRRRHRALRCGSLESLDVRGDVLYFERVLDAERLAVVINFADAPAELGLQNVASVLAASSDDEVLEPGGYRIFQLN